MNKFIIFLVVFANLTVNAQEVPYGSNPAAGKYLQNNGAKIYYEVYGTGEPLLLLHGDVFGYIDEFAEYIPLLSKQFKVIAVGMRGHGKSEIGEAPFSYKLFADDALAVLKQEGHDSAVVVGFSAGAVIGYYLAAYYPGKIRKLVAMGGGLGSADFRPSAVPELRSMNIDSLEKKYPGFIQSRKDLMVQPQRYQELINRLKKTWFQKYYVDPARLKSIRCPVLVVGGDRDHYMEISSFVNTYKKIRGAQLAIAPNCDHVGLIRYPTFFKEIVIPFLTEQ